jgi:hypothetical protein
MEGYPVNTTFGKLTNMKNANLGEDNGYRLRLMVVGINSFNDKNNNGTFPHLVFQFQNFPAYHRMNETANNDGGYAVSEGRAYLVPVSGKTGSGAFQRGLGEAGVPFNLDWIWGPRGYVANAGYTNATGADLITDKLWLPTEREVFDSNVHSNTTYETAANQAWLGYYTSNESRIKYDSDGGNYPWVTASPSIGATYLYCIISSGMTDFNYVTNFFGFAPAFCVK